jgi:hypothetical protein
MAREVEARKFYPLFDEKENRAFLPAEIFSQAGNGRNWTAGFFSKM